MELVVVINGVGKSDLSENHAIESLEECIPHRTCNNLFFSYFLYCNQFYSHFNSPGESKCEIPLK